MAWERKKGARLPLTQPKDAPLSGGYNCEESSTLAALWKENECLYFQGLFSFFFLVGQLITIFKKLELLGF